MTNETRPNAIRELAYAKWEQAGWPQGDGVDFWLLAEQEILGAELEASFPETESQSLKLAKATGNSRKKAG